MNRFKLTTFAAILSLAAVLRADEEANPGGDSITVWLFVITDCPIANAYAPEINRIFHDYSGRGVTFSLIYPDETLTAEEMDRHREEYQLKPDGRLDPGRKFVRKAGATVTPEAVVFDRKGEIVYRGRIDDRYTDYGDKRSQPRERNLRLALDAVLAGKPVRVGEAPAIGCLIEDL